jgi:hypothetical protein
MINPKFLYICPKDVALAHAFRHCTISHCIDLPDGNVLLSAEFLDELKKGDLEKNVTVEPCAEDEPVSNKHAAQLAHLGVKAGHTAKQIRKLAKAVHPLI